jgi:hypothetical protein
MIRTNKALTPRFERRNMIIGKFLECAAAAASDYNFVSFFWPVAKRKMAVAARNSP